MRSFRGILASIVMLIISGTAVAQQSGSPIGYPSVAAALNGERNKPGAAVSTQDGWMIITDRATATIWSFTPLGHPADPSAVRRKIVQRRNEIFVEMAVACEAPKAACDNLVTEFKQLNEKMRQGLNQGR